MRITALLADHAQVADGKLNLLGGGWTVTGPGVKPFAIALLIDVPWDRANERHVLRLELLDADGHPVTHETAEGEVATFIEANFEVGRPAGLTPGTAISVPLALNIGPQALAPEGRYVWRISVNGESDDTWRLPFSVRAAVSGG